MVSTPRRCNSIITSLPSSPAPRSITFTAAEESGVPSFMIPPSFLDRLHREAGRRLAVAPARHHLLIGRLDMAGGAHGVEQRRLGAIAGEMVAIAGEQPS